jgi:hypothetical protein
MTRKTQLTIIAAVFLCMQFLPSLHLAEFGIVQHSHDGATCTIFLVCDNAKISVNSVFDLNLKSFVFLTKEEVESFEISFHQNSFQPRDPPFFS